MDQEEYEASGPATRFIFIRYMKSILFILFLLIASIGCSSSPDTTPISQEATTDPRSTTNGGGEPRSSGYWLLWNSCAPDNRSETAEANGGAEAGWFLVDDLLADPGISLGDFVVADCQTAVSLLNGEKPGGGPVSGEDLAYPLARQLLVAELNLNTGAENCPVAEAAVQTSQLLFFSVSFDGAGTFLTPASATPEQLQTAESLIESLEQYNVGSLCR